MFNDPSAQIDELTGIIKAEITQITEAISGLQQLAARSGGGGQQSEAHVSSVVESLRGRLKDVTAEFKEVLTVRSEALKAHDQRRQLFSSQPEAPAFSEQAPLLLAPDGSASRSASTLFGGQVRQRRGDASSQPPPYGSPGGGGGGGSAAFQQQQQMQLPPQQQRGYASSRAEALSSVEATIVELGSMFTQLAELVTSHGEMAARIDENIDETLGHVEGARTQLMSYLTRMSSNRGLLTKVLLVLMALMAVFVLFVA